MSQAIKEAIGSLVEAVKKNPAEAASVFRASTYSEAHTFTTRSRLRGFDVKLDEPRELGGEDVGPNPVEAVLAALGSCQEIVYRAYAAMLGPMVGVPLRQLTRDVAPAGVCSALLVAVGEVGEIGETGARLATGSQRGASRGSAPSQ